MRTGRQAAIEVARTLLDSATSTIWTAVSNDLQSALLDRAVMDHVRRGDEESSITIGELVAFRALVEDVLAEGITRGGRTRGLKTDDRREHDRDAARDARLRAQIEAEIAIESTRKAAFE